MKEWKTITYALNYDVSNYGEVRQNKKNRGFHKEYYDVDKKKGE